MHKRISRCRIKVDILVHDSCEEENLDLAISYIDQIPEVAVFSWN
jgi:hypothetical protein